MNELYRKIDVQLSDYKNEVGIIKAYHAIPETLFYIQTCRVAIAAS